MMLSDVDRQFMSISAHCTRGLRAFADFTMWILGEVCVYTLFTPARLLKFNAAGSSSEVLSSMSSHTTFSV